MRVLVTGGAGFVGSHVVDALLDTGASVRVVDDLSARGGAMAGAPKHLDPKAELMVGDLAEPATAVAAVESVDAVCHQAAKVGLGVDFGDVGTYVRANDTATASLLEALWARSFAGRFVLASSMVIYGEGRYSCARHGEVRPGPRDEVDLSSGRFDPRCPRDGCDEALRSAAVDETTTPDPRNVYAATKLHQEHLCDLWGREAGATVVSLRYHNIYGPRMPRNTPYAGVASLFRNALATGQPPEVFEDGLQTRDFVHVCDVARANVLALFTNNVTAGPCNVASGSPRTVWDLASALSDAIDPSLTPVVSGRWRAGDVRHVVGSPTRAEATLGFVAATSFEAGIAELAGSGERLAT